MKYELIIGPGFYSTKPTQNLFTKNNHTVTIHGDAENKINCEKLLLAKNSYVVIKAHGSIDQRMEHNMNLCYNIKTSLYALPEISKKNPIHIELFSCFGGAAISSIYNLPKWSTLITSSTASYSSIIDIGDEIINKNLVLPNGKNIFIKFAHYILINPNTNQFAINTHAGGKIFVSSIETAKQHSFTRFWQWITGDYVYDFSDQGIVKWQNTELNKFIDFCQNIKTDLQENKYLTKQLDFFLEFFSNNNSKNTWSNNFDIKYYKELLLINMSNQANYDAVKLLLGSGVNINATTENGKNSLMIALTDTKNPNIVKLLLENNISINHRSDDGASSLILAVSRKGSPDLIKLLLDAGVSVDTQDPKQGWTALHFAIVENNFAVAELLLNYKADVMKKTFGNMSALHLALNAEMDLKMLELLVEYGANVNDIINEKNNNLLDLAASANNPYYVNFLLKHGADINAKASDGSSVVTIAKGHKDGKISKIIAKAKNALDNNPIEYTLKQYEQPKAAFKALENIGNQSHYAQFHSDIIQTKECLSHLSEAIAHDLNKICGEDGSYYTHLEL